MELNKIYNEDCLVGMKHIPGKLAFSTLYRTRIDRA